MTHDFQNGRCVKCQVSLETFNERWGMVACVPSVDVSWNVNASPVECPKEANEKILKETGYATDAVEIRQQASILPPLPKYLADEFAKMEAEKTKALGRFWLSGKATQEPSDYKPETFDVTFTPSQGG